MYLHVCWWILPLRDEQSAVSTERVRGVDCSDLFLEAWRQQRELVPEEDKQITY